MTRSGAEAWAVDRASSASGAPSGEAAAARGAGLTWLLRLRWAAASSGLAVVVAGYFLVDRALPLAPMLGLIGGTLLSNAVVTWHRREGNAGDTGGAGESTALPGALMLFDSLTLTALLALSGGPSNPFTVLYMVQVTMAAVMLDARWAWTLVAASIAGFGSLFVAHVPLAPLAHRAGHPGAFGLHLQGMLLAFGITATLIAYLASRVTRALRARERELVEAQLRNERMASLTTLAAGAAHELGSPLGTIAVAAGELERALGELDGAATPELRDDARLIRSEVTRCRAILDQMGSKAGENVGEGPETVSASTLLDLAVTSLDEPRRSLVQVSADLEASATSLVVPPRATAMALANLLRNALDASPSDTSVELSVSREAAGFRFAVRDYGPGMSPETVARATEPFFTTKEAGHGMGLGLYLTQVLVERLGGRLRLESVPSQGTTASISLPG